MPSRWASSSAVWKPTPQMSVGQAIRVRAHQLDGLVAVGLVDADGPGGADAVRLQEDHDVADGLLLLPALADLLDALRADALDLLAGRTGSRR